MVAEFPKLPGFDQGGDVGVAGDLVLLGFRGGGGFADEGLDLGAFKAGGAL